MVEPIEKGEPRYSHRWYRRGNGLMLLLLSQRYTGMKKKKRENNLFLDRYWPSPRLYRQKKKKSGSSSKGAQEVCVCVCVVYTSCYENDRKFLPGKRDFIASDEIIPHLHTRPLYTYT